MSRTLQEDVEASLENMSDGGGTVAEHAALLARDHGLSVLDAAAVLNKALDDACTCGVGYKQHITGCPALWGR